MQFGLEALQANDGDCLLLHYQPSGGKLIRILIDGGSRGVYTSVLRPRIDELRRGGRLDLRMVMVSHIDADHITGIVDLLRDLQREEEGGGEEEPFCRIRTLWFNSFDKLSGNKEAATQSAAVGASLNGVVPAGVSDQAAAVVSSVAQGNALRNAATGLGIQFNQGAGADLVLAPAGGARSVSIADGLSFTILGPHQEQLDSLNEQWQASKTAHPGNTDAQAADYLNRTVPNLSSIVVLAEAARAENAAPLRMLLTGDAGGDHILESLERLGLLDDTGKLRVDLLKVMHHGSKHSVEQSFFERVIADHYVISGNGKHGNPHRETLEWLSAARPGQRYDVYMTNRTGLNDLGAILDGFLQNEAQHQPKHIYNFRDEHALSIPVALA
jgi:hypothetical protein